MTGPTEDPSKNPPPPFNKEMEEALDRMAFEAEAEKLPSPEMEPYPVVAQTIEITDKETRESFVCAKRFVCAKTDEQVKESIAEFEKLGYRIVAPGHVPSDAEVALLKIRTERSKESREQFADRCEALNNDLKKSQNSFGEGLARIACRQIAAEAKKASVREYAPQTFKGRLLLAIERALSHVVSWFHFRETPVTQVEIVAAEDEQAAAMRKYYETLAGLLSEGMDQNEGVPRDAYFDACWEMMQDLKDGRLVVMAGETRRDALRRTVSEHQERFEERQEAMAEEDHVLGFCDHRERSDDNQNAVKEMEKEIERAFGEALLPKNNKRVSIGRGTDPSKMSNARDAGFVVSTRPSPKMLDESVKVEAGITVEGAPEDPLLLTAKVERLKELLSKQDLTDDEKKQLADLTSESVTLL